MNEIFNKTIGLLSESDLSKLDKSLVIIVGLGGVGGFVFESLIRTGIKNYIIIDKDLFEITNLNRQLAATKNTISKYKVDVYFERGKSINENANIVSINRKIDNNNINTIFNEINKFNDIEHIFVADCIDDINAKIEIIKKCHNDKIKLISSMGTANHISSRNILISNLKNSKYCPLAKKIRTYFNKDNEINPKILFINEEPLDISKNRDDFVHTSTIQYVPAIAGLKIAEYIINDIIK